MLQLRLFALVLILASLKVKFILNQACSFITFIEFLNFFHTEYPNMFFQLTKVNTVQNKILKKNIYHKVIVS